MDEDMAAGWAHWCDIKVVGPKEVFPGGDMWLCGAGAQKIEGELRLGKEQIPMIFWIVGGCTGKDGKEVVFEHADATFSCVAPMDVWRH